MTITPAKLWERNRFKTSRVNFYKKLLQIVGVFEKSRVQKIGNPLYVEVVLNMYYGPMMLTNVGSELMREQHLNEWVI